MNLSESAGEPANVVAAGRSFTLSPISTREETLLARRWEAIARSKDDERDQKAYARVKKCPDAEGRTAMYQELAKEIKRDLPPENYAVFVEARQSADGVLEELFARTREAHPDVTKEDIKALLNPHNAEDVHNSILDALEKMCPKPRTL